MASDKWYKFNALHEFYRIAFTNTRYLNLTCFAARLSADTVCSYDSTRGFAPASAPVPPTAPPTAGADSDRLGVELAFLPPGGNTRGVAFTPPDTATVAVSPEVGEEYWYGLPPTAGDTTGGVPVTGAAGGVAGTADDVDAMAGTGPEPRGSLPGASFKSNFPSAPILYELEPPWSQVTSIQPLCSSPVTVPTRETEAS